MHSTVPGRCQTSHKRVSWTLCGNISSPLPRSQCVHLSPGRACSAGNLSLVVLPKEAVPHPQDSKWRSGRRVEVERPLGWLRARTHRAASCSLPWWPTHKRTDSVHTLSLPSLRGVLQAQGQAWPQPAPPGPELERPRGAAELGNLWPPGPRKGLPTPCS